MTDDPRIETTYFVLPESATDTTESLVAEWFGMGYFQDAPWTHPEKPYRQNGISGTPLRYSLGNDAGLSALAFFCTILFILVVRDVKRSLLQATKSFFFLSVRTSATDDRGADRENSGEKDRYLRSAFGTSFLMCLLGGMGVFVYFCAEDKVQTDGIRPYVYTGVYAGLLAAYMLFRLFACQFVHWVFFNKSQTAVWNKTNYYTINFEGLVCIPILTFSLFGSIPTRMAVLYLLTVIFLCKLLSFYNTFRIFFGKLHGLLHLFVYLCTLEITPLLVLVKALTSVALGLTIKN